MKRLLCAVGTVMMLGQSFVLVAAGSAAADPPERHSLSYDDVFVTRDFCGFRTKFEWVGTGYGIIFTDSNGNFVKQRDRIAETLTVTSLRSGKSLSGKNHYTISFNAEDGTFTRVGLWFHLNSPGEGVVLHDVGRAVFDSDGNLVFEAGQHQWLEGDIQGMCRALA